MTWKKILKQLNPVRQPQPQPSNQMLPRDDSLTVTQYYESPLTPKFMRDHFRLFQRDKLIGAGKNPNRMTMKEYDEFISGGQR
jgi:hypothetical protein|tara:strand:+ start:3243 stop:3491 length:249 start_codon:yes stop_codon:yes gene_type:complete